MCDKVILENSGTLNFIPDCYKNQKSCYNTVDNHFHALEFVPDCCKTQKISDKAVDTRPLQYGFFLVDMRLNNCAIKLLPKNLLC